MYYRIHMYVLYCVVCVCMLIQGAHRLCHVGVQKFVDMGIDNVTR